MFFHRFFTSPEVSANWPRLPAGLPGGFRQAWLFPKGLETINWVNSTWVNAS